MIRGQASTIGPLVDLVVDNIEHHKKALAKNVGLSVPPPMRGLALVDTGATVSMISTEVADALRALRAGALSVRGLQPAKPWELAPPSHVRACMVAFDLGIYRGNFTVGVAPLRGAFAGAPIVAIVGRDALARFELIYDGPTQACVLRLVAS